MDVLNEVRLLKADLLSTECDWDKMKTSANRLREIGGSDAYDFFIGLLDLDYKYALSRNIAALTIMDIDDNKAVEPLINAILKKENINHNGTLVYALEKFDCSNKFKELFEILFYHGYEAKIGARHILAEQQFSFTQQDLIEIKSKWEELKLHPIKNYEDAKELIDEVVGRYLPYLEAN